MAISYIHAAPIKIIGIVLALSVFESDPLINRLETDLHF